MTTNPFNITKAVDYSDEEINSYWVDIGLTGGFTSIVKPTSPMPMYILGGKGSGKTHIMRYFSYNLQKLRYGKTIPDKIKEDGYLGIYMRCQGLNSSKFGGKGLSEETWDSVFRYYLELWFSQLLLSSISDLANENRDIFTEDLESKVCAEITDIFDQPVDGSVENTFEGLQLYLRSLQKKVDFSVNNLAIVGGDLSNLQILVSDGRLIFGIPQILRERVPLFKEVLFLYLVDEFENLTAEQQQYFNTLLRERQAPSTFKIGARHYGIRTHLTFSAEEENKLDSEFEIYNIDKQFREKPQEYGQFVKSICVKKLVNSGLQATLDPTSEKYINKFFAEFDTEAFQARLESKKDSKSKSYFNRLERELKAQLKDDNERQKIIEALTFDNNRLLERTNVFLFYREWKRRKQNLTAAAASIAKSCEEYSNGARNNMHDIVLDKFKNDIIDYLYRESGDSATYLGLENFIRMSSGIPRYLLIMLKHIFRWANFNGEKPFSGEHMISEESQRNGLKDAALWFLEDARVPGSIGVKVQISFGHLGSYLQTIRFSATPPECSISSFRIDSQSLDERMLEILSYLEKYSYIIKVGERRDNNSNRQDVTYQINGIIAPHYELSINRRGVVNLSVEDLTSIFNSFEDNNESFKSFLNSKRKRYNPPFNHTNSHTLFQQ